MSLASSSFSRSSLLWTFFAMWSARWSVAVCTAFSQRTRMVGSDSRPSSSSVGVIIRRSLSDSDGSSATMMAGVSPMSFGSRPTTSL